MKRMRSSFYKELKEVRDQFGVAEYSRDQILPAVMGLLRKHEVQESDLLRDAANAVLDSAEKQDDHSMGGLFNYDAAVALDGDNRPRIKRGFMNRSQLMRRKRVIDNNKVAQDRAWAEESNWLNVRVDALENLPPTTVVRDVLDEDGRAPKRADGGGPLPAHV